MKLPEILSPKQLKKFFEVIEDPQYMVLYLLATLCGLRRETLVALKKSQVDLSDGFIRIRNDKNPLRNTEGYGSDRNVPIPDNLMPLLELWMQYNPTTEYLFPSLFHGKSHLSDSAPTKQILIDIKRAGIENPHYVDKGGKRRFQYHFHTLRHSYATIYYEKTGDIVGLQRNLGHKSIQTTQIYTNISVGERKRRVDEVFSPRKSYFNDLNPEKCDVVDMEKIRHENRMKELEMELKIEQLKSGDSAR